jgi:hypothetical protein
MWPFLNYLEFSTRKLLPSSGESRLANLADALKFLLLLIVFLTGDLKNHPK